ncbi:MAG: he65 [Betabaculovirus sp.]|nr:MAG: he65 [Betabaculovirus sp.]
MVFIVVDTGSRAKGYAIESSDLDLKVYSKCSREHFELYIDNKQILKNVHKRVMLCDVVDTPVNMLCDVVYIDLYVGMIGIVTGKNPELGVFLKETDIKNGDSTVNTQLYKYIKRLTHLSMCAIVTTMMKYVIMPKNKNLLQLMFNYVYMEYYLKYGTTPNSTNILNIVYKLNDDTMATLVNIHNATMYQQKVVDMYVKLMNRDNCNEENVVFFEHWKNDILKRLMCTCNENQQAILRHNVVMYAMHLQEPILKL